MVYNPESVFTFYDDFCHPPLILMWIPISCIIIIIHSHLNCEVQPITSHPYMTTSVCHPGVSDDSGSAPLHPDPQRQKVIVCLGMETVLTTSCKHIICSFACSAAFFYWHPLTNYFLQVFAKRLIALKSSNELKLLFQIKLSDSCIYRGPLTWLFVLVCHHPGEPVFSSQQWNLPRTTAPPRGRQGVPGAAGQRSACVSEPLINFRLFLRLMK